MGKAGKKKKKSSVDYDALFHDESKHSGVADMAIEAANAPAAAVAVPDNMDTAELPCGSRKTKLGIPVGHIKIGKRGNKSTAQKKRQSAKLEKALERADKTVTRVTGRSAKQQKKQSLKSIY